MKVLKVLMAFFVIVAFFRAMNGAGDFSLTALLVDLQEFDFDIEPIKRFIAMFRGGDLGIFSWNNNLAGITGFFQNLANFFNWLFAYVWQLIASVFDAVWNTVSELFRLAYTIITLFLDIFGYTFAPA